MLLRSWLVGDDVTTRAQHLLLRMVVVHVYRRISAVSDVAAGPGGGVVGQQSIFEPGYYVVQEPLDLGVGPVLHHLLYQQQVPSLVEVVDPRYD